MKGKEYINTVILDENDEHLDLSNFLHSHFIQVHQIDNGDRVILNAYWQSNDYETVYLTVSINGMENTWHCPIEFDDLFFDAKYDVLVSAFYTEVWRVLFDDDDEIIKNLRGDDWDYDAIITGYAEIAA